VSVLTTVFLRQKSDPNDCIQTQRKELEMDATETNSEARPAKIQAYVATASKAYLVKLAKQNARKISAQLDLILKEHEAANG